MDAATLTVPLWPALVAGAAILSGVLGVIAWAFANFQRKSDSECWEEVMDKRLSAQEALLSKVAQDVAFLRGRLES